MTEEEWYENEMKIIRDFWLTLTGVLVINPLTLILLFYEQQWEIWLIAMTGLALVGSFFSAIFREIDHLQGTEVIAIVFLRLAWLGVGALLGFDIGKDSLYIGLGVTLLFCYYTYSIGARHRENPIGFFFWRAWLAHQRIRLRGRV